MSIEYFVLMSLVLVLIPLLFIALKDTNVMVKINQAQDVVGVLTITANAVHNLGSGNKESVWVRIPNDVNGTEVKGKDLSIDLNFDEGNRDVISTAQPDLIGHIPSEPGLRQIPVKAINATLVKIGPGVVLLEVKPPCVEKNNLPTEIKLVGDEFAAGLILIINGQEYFSIHTSGYVNFMDSSDVRFLADPQHFESVPLGDPYALQVKNLDGIISNEAIFRVVSNMNFC